MARFRTTMRGGIAALVLAAAPTGRAFAIDCAKARLPVEAALCDDPVAKASDEAMATAFTTVRDALPAEAKAAALADQRTWLKARAEACPTPDMPLPLCLTRENRQRIAILTGRAETGPGLVRRPIPVFVRQAGGRGRVEVAVRVYRFADAAGPGEAALNALADKSLAGIAYQAGSAEAGSSVSHSDAWTITYGSPTFLAIRREVYDFGGGPHGTTTTEGVNLDLRTGREAVVSDAFDAKARDTIAATCLDQIRAQKKEREADIPDLAALKKTIAETVAAMKSWTIREDAATIVFDAYAIGAYAESQYECVLPARTLTTLAKAPFPPR